MSGKKPLLDRTIRSRVRRAEEIKAAEARGRALGQQAIQANSSTSQTNNNPTGKDNTMSTITKKHNAQAPVPAPKLSWGATVAAPFKGLWSALKAGLGWLWTKAVQAKDLVVSGSKKLGTKLGEGKDRVVAGCGEAKVKIRNGLGWLWTKAIQAKDGVVSIGRKAWTKAGEVLGWARTKLGEGWAWARRQWVAFKDRTYVIWGRIKIWAYARWLDIYAWSTANPQVSSIMMLVLVALIGAAAWVFALAPGKAVALHIV